MTGAAIVVLCVFVFASGWLSCAAVRAMAGDREDVRLRARLPRCSMTAPDGSERRTCSCLGPADCQPDVKQLSLDLRGGRLRDLPARPLTEAVARTRRGYPIMSSFTKQLLLDRMCARTGVEPTVVEMSYDKDVKQ